MDVYNVVGDRKAKSLIRVIMRNRNQFVAPYTIRKIFRMFVKWKKSNKDEWPGIRSFERDVVYYLIERCYWLEYDDPQLVAVILKLIMEMDGHIGILFFRRITTMRQALKFRPRSFWCNHFLSDREVQPVHYFTRQANSSKLTLNGRRFPDALITQYGVHVPPCATAYLLKLPDYFTFLLQNGALISTGRDGDDDFSAVVSSKIMRWTVGSVIATSPNYDINNVDFDVPANTDSIGHSLICGNILLRSVMRVDSSDLLKYYDTRMSSEQKASFIRKLSSPSLLPNLDRRTIDPPELKHLCRCTIRKALYVNWELPLGIYRLGLPGWLERYLNLELD